MHHLTPPRYRPSPGVFAVGMLCLCPVSWRGCGRRCVRGREHLHPLELRLRRYGSAAVVVTDPCHVSRPPQATCNLR